MALRVILDGRTIQDHFPGIGRYVYNLAAALAGRPDAPALTLLFDPTRPSTRFDLDALGRRVRLAPAPFSPFDIRSQFAIPRLLRRLGADLYHATYYVMPYAAGPPTVVTLYDAIPLAYPDALSPPARRAYRALNRLAGRRARRILTISQAAADDLERTLRLPATRIDVTPLAADARFRPADPAIVERWRSAAGLPAGYVLYLGINKPHKNLVRLAQAWGILRRDWPAGAGEMPRLILAGREDPRYPQARQAVAAGGLGADVLFWPEIADDDLPLLYNGARAFVLPSLYEGFGLPALEAMACGTPLACSDRSPLPELAGGAAELFDPENIEEMAAALRRLLADPELRRRRAAAGLARAAAFSWERTARLTAGSYQRAASGPAALTALSR